jgi:hypothetical protein
MKPRAFETHHDVCRLGQTIEHAGNIDESNGHAGALQGRQRCPESGSHR